MSNMSKKIINYAFSGLSIGSVVSVACLWILNGKDDTIVQVAAWLIASTLFGLISIVFEIENIKLLYATAIHFAVCLSISLITGYFLGYSNTVLGLAKNIFPIFVLVYVLVYASSFIYSYHNAKQINKKLSE